MLPRILEAGMPQAKVWALFISGKPAKHCFKIDRAARIGWFWDTYEITGRDGVKRLRVRTEKTGKIIKGVEEKRLKTYTQTLYDAELRNRETGEIVRI